MINTQPCKDCDHIDVCGKKSQYQNFISAIKNADTEQGKANYLYFKDFKDVTVDIHCSYFKLRSGIYDSANGGAKDNHILTPEEFKNKMDFVDKRYTGDEEIMHIEADELMCYLLTKLGYGDGIDIFNKMKKWYA